jgi:hypothetical protein
MCCDDKVKYLINNYEDEAINLPKHMFGRDYSRIPRVSRQSTWTSVKDMATIYSYIFV